MSLSKQLYIIIAFIFFIIFSGNFIISVTNMKEYLELESSTKAQDTATSLGMSLRPLIKDKEDPEIESIIKVISNSGFYKEIRLEDVDFTITDKELIGASTDLDDSNWQINAISVNPKFGYVEKVQSDKTLNDQLLKLENDQEDLGFEEEIESISYKYVPSDLYKNGGNITFNFTASKGVQNIDTFSNLEIKKDVFLSLAGFSIEFVESFGFPKKVLDLYFLFNEFSTKFISLKLDDKSILDFLNDLDAFRRPNRLNIFLNQIQYFFSFHKINEKEKIDVFIDLHEIIKEKIEYGDLSLISVEEIKKRVEHININIITLVLSKKSK